MTYEEEQAFRRHIESVKKEAYEEAIAEADAAWEKEIKQLIPRLRHLANMDIPAIVRLTRRDEDFVSRVLEDEDFVSRVLEEEEADS